MASGMRLLHSSSVLRCTVALVSKQLLGKLRKSTGFSISHCKKALQMHNNDIDQAGAWLASRAQEEGWARATKLSGRVTRQGLVGVVVHQDHTKATMMELNCETDFVARNGEFAQLTRELALACLSASSTQHWNHHDPTVPTIHKEMWNREQVGVLPGRDGKCLADHVALAIGRLGENMSIARALKVSSSGGADVQLYGHTHPSSSQEGQEDTDRAMVGKFGAVVAVRSLTDTPPDQHLVKQLCMHIIGLYPTAVGTLHEGSGTEDTATTAEAVEVMVDKTAAKAVEEEEEDMQVEKTRKIKTSHLLLHQAWINNEDMTVAEVLDEAGLQVIDFVRLECGEDQPEHAQQ